MTLISKVFSLRLWRENTLKNLKKLKLTTSTHFDVFLIIFFLQELNLTLESKDPHNILLVLRVRATLIISWCKPRDSHISFEKRFARIMVYITL